jgi:hypothetical protein
VDTPDTYRADARWLDSSDRMVFDRLSLTTTSREVVTGLLDLMLTMLVHTISDMAWLR